MISVILLLVAACFAGIQAAPSLPPLPVNPGGIGGLFRGPNSETIIKGPDGSQIISEQLGGSVETEAILEPIIVPDVVDDQVAVSSFSAAPLEAENGIRTVSYSPISIPPNDPIDPPIDLQVVPHQIAVEPIVPAVPAEVVPAVLTAGEPHIIETEYVDAPEIEPNQSSDLKGPSGTISVRGSSSIVSGPASTTISEPVKKIPIATLPVQPEFVQSQQQYSAAIDPSLSIPAAVIPPSSLPALRTDLVAPPPAQIRLIRPEDIGTRDTELRTDLVPPPIQILSSMPRSPITVYNEAVSPAEYTHNTPLISLTGTSGAGIADATLRTDLAPPHITIIASTQAPPLDLPTQNTIDSRHTFVSSSVSPVSSSSADIDASKINLGQSTNQLFEISNVSPNWNAPPSDEPNVVYSELASASAKPFLGYTSEVNENYHDGRPTFPLLTTAADLRRSHNIGSTSGVSNSNGIIHPDLNNDGFPLRDQAILTNQLVSSTPRYSAIDSRDLISSYQDPNDVTFKNFLSRPWLNEEPQQILPSTISPPLGDRNHGAPIASIADTVLVQPTDPKNREIIEFGGKQLENVGNIVPVVRHPILVTGELNYVQQIPTASISQLSSTNQLDRSIPNRYGRNAQSRN